MAKAKLTDPRSREFEMRDFSELYVLYRKYTLAVYDGDESMCRSEEEFAEWWGCLPDQVRADTEAAYRKGRDQVISEGAAEIRKAVEKAAQA